MSETFGQVVVCDFEYETGALPRGKVTCRMCCAWLRTC